MAKTFAVPCPFCSARCRIRSSVAFTNKLTRLTCICISCGATFRSGVEVYEIINKPVDLEFVNEKKIEKVNTPTEIFSPR